MKRGATLAQEEKRRVAAAAAEDVVEGLSILSSIAVRGSGGAYEAKRLRTTLVSVGSLAPGQRMSDDLPVTEYLHAWSEGDPQALEDLMALVYTELQAISRGLLRRERQSHTLNPTALVHEVYMRLARLKKVSWENRTPFFAFTARLMRRLIVEHARAAQAQKRAGWGKRVDLEIADLLGRQEEQKTIDVLNLESVLERLDRENPVLARIIELRFFSGLNEEETASALGVSRTTVQRQWRIGRRLLARELRGAK